MMSVSGRQPLALDVSLTPDKEQSIGPPGFPTAMETKQQLL